MMRALQVALLFPALLACGETDECKQLALISSQYDQAVATVKARVALKSQSEKRLAKHEALAKEEMSKLGLDLPETKLKEELDARVAKIPGATVERTTRAVSDVGDEGGAIHETLWRIQYSAKDDAQAFEHMRMLVKEPPLFMLSTLLKDDKGKWMLELLRASVTEVPMNVKPTPLPKPKSASEVPEQLGFCGASGLREQIAQKEQEFEKSRAEAEELSVMLPKVATYEGLQRRAQLLGEEERETRRLIEAFINAVQKAKLRFRAAGVERAVVIYEIHGGQAERAKLERALPEDVLKGMKELESSTKNVIRLSVVNRVTDEQIKRSGSLRPGVGLAPEKK